MSREKLFKLEETLNRYNLERQDVVHGTILSLLSNKNILYLGEPGTAKTRLAVQLTKLIEGATIFQYLMTKYTLPEELFGPISLKHLKEDRLVRVSEGMVQNSSIIFLDEIFKSNSSILNTLLTLLNERVYYENGKANKTPLMLCIGASNEIPDESDGLEALQDRFILKYLVNKIKIKSNFEKMLLLNETEENQNLKPIISLDEIKELSKNSQDVIISNEIIDLIYKIRTQLEKEGIFVTDRTYKNSISILKAEAFLNNRNEVIDADLIILKNILWSNPKDYKKVYFNILELVDPISTQINEFLDHARNLYENYIKEKDNEEKIKKGIEVSNKIRDIKKKVTVLMKNTVISKLNEFEKDQIINQFDIYLHKIHEIVAKEVNIDFTNFLTE